ncbi:hypothetical protein [uncultured Tateyamaria sp.]|uniref:hypothetical protein n=1 Tax=uncultured Tateyamaria sp. TaxID=455651 RepID=UPI0026131D42|nr:hypothetical protein [uncultured Tateyamaria sp.]
MMNPNQHGPNGQGGGMNMKDGFASTLAAMISVLLSAPLNEFTQPYVILYAQRTYAPELVNLIAIVWMILCWPLVFFAARASIIAGLTAAGVYLAYRFI